MVFIVILVVIEIVVIQLVVCTILVSNYREDIVVIVVVVVIVVIVVVVWALFRVFIGGVINGTVIIAESIRSIDLQTVISCVIVRIIANVVTRLTPSFVSGQMVEGNKQQKRQTFYS